MRYSGPIYALSRMDSLESNNLLNYVRDNGDNSDYEFMIRDFWFLLELFHVHFVGVYNFVGSPFLSYIHIDISTHRVKLLAIH